MPAIRRVAAVLLGGSAARGHADRYSDIELFVIWREPPTEADRAMAIAAAGGDLVTLYPVEDNGVGPLWQDAWKIGRRATSRSLASRSTGATFLVETVERVLGDVVDLCDPDPTKQVAVGGILHSIPLHGAQLIADWQERAARYPDGLRVAVVKAHAQIEFLWRLDAYVARDNPVAGHQLLSAAHEDLLHVLLGLNRVVLLGLQVPHGRSLGSSDRAARSASSEFARHIHSRPGRSKAMLTALVEETHDLVEEQLPEIDVERLREILRYDRPLWE